MADDSADVWSKMDKMAEIKQRSIIGAPAGRSRFWTCGFISKLDTKNATGVKKSRQNFGTF